MKRLIDLAKEPIFKLKPLVVMPHPMRHRINDFRSIPSLVTGGKTLEDKYEKDQRNLGGNNPSTESSGAGQA